MKDYSTRRRGLFKSLNWQEGANLICEIAEQEDSVGDRSGAQRNNVMFAVWALPQLLVRRRPFCLSARKRQTPNRHSRLPIRRSV